MGTLVAGTIKTVENPEREVHVKQAIAGNEQTMRRPIHICFDKAKINRGVTTPLRMRFETDTLTGDSIHDSDVRLR